jgi:hypothetical protein
MSSAPREEAGVGAGGLALAFLAGALAGAAVALQGASQP